MAAAIGVIVVVAVLIILSELKVLKEYERGVVFRLGRLTPYRGPGVILSRSSSAGSASICGP
jgi:regulator of protease activity HflC (stomatin/prohibitin superfamily)